MKYVYIESEELIAKRNYFFIFLAFSIIIISLFSIKLLDFSGIIKWILYFNAGFFFLISLLAFIPLVRYCKNCNKPFDFDVVECPICHSKLIALTKNSVELLLRKSAQEKESVSFTGKDNMETRQAISGSKNKQEPNEAIFVKEYSEEKMEKEFTYRIYTAQNKASAKALLEENRVNKPFHYIIVETPEGNWGRDINGIYKE